jgi:hypothetical protein
MSIQVKTESLARGILNGLPYRQEGHGPGTMEITTPLDQMEPDEWCGLIEFACYLSVSEMPPESELPKLIDGILLSTACL